MVIEEWMQAAGEKQKKKQKKHISPINKKIHISNTLATHIILCMQSTGGHQKKNAHFINQQKTNQTHSFLVSSRKKYSFLMCTNRHISSTNRKQTKQKIGLHSTEPKKHRGKKGGNRHL
jgi:hypothetical protein